MSRKEKSRAKIVSTEKKEACHHQTPVGVTHVQYHGSYRLVKVSCPSVRPVRVVQLIHESYDPGRLIYSRVVQPVRVVTTRIDACSAPASGVTIPTTRTGRLITRAWKATRSFFFFLSSKSASTDWLRNNKHDVASRRKLAPRRRGRKSRVRVPLPASFHLDKSSLTSFISSCGRQKNATFFLDEFPCRKAGMLAFQQGDLSRRDLTYLSVHTSK